MKIDGATWTFTKAELVALLAHMAGDERPSQAALQLQTARRRAVATDGHRAITCSLPSPHEASVAPADCLVPRPTIEWAVQNAKTKDEIRIIVAPDSELISVFVAAFSFTVKPAPGPFPGVDYILRRPDANAPGVSEIGLDVGYLGDLVLMRAACGKYPKKEGRKTILVQEQVAFRIPPGELDPIHATCFSHATGCAWHAVIMPVRL